MPSFTPITKRFDALLLAYHTSSPKPKKVTYHPAQSEYNGMNEADYNSDFGSGNSRKESYTDPTTGQQQTRIVTSSSLAPNLQGSQQSAASGLQSNLDYLRQSPDQRIASITSGNDPVFAALEVQRQKAEDQAAGRAALRAQGTGNLNSTAYGSTLSGIDNESQNRRLQDMVTALQYGNDTATQGVNTNMGVQSGLAGLVYPLESAAGSTLQTGLNANNQIGLTNAQQQLAADQYNAQKMDAYNQQQYNNSLMSGLSTLDPFVGFASGHNQQAMQGLGMYAQAAGAAAGMGGFGGGGGVTSAAPSAMMPSYPNTLPNWNNFDTNLNHFTMAVS